MDTPDLLSRLHDTLRAAQRIRLPGPGCTAGAAVESVDEVKGMLRGLIRDLGAPEPARHAPRQVATVAAFPAGDGVGARPTVQHRRRARRVGSDRLPRTEPASRTAEAARVAAEALFAPSRRAAAG